MSKKVLVADDDPLIRMLVEQMLGASGFEVQAVDGGTPCLEALGQDLPDILFLDLMMPDLSGVEVLKNLRSSENMKKLPVVILSASLAGDRVMDGSDHAPDGFVEKPFKVEDLKREIERLT